jgi:predicted DNA-binding protein with PD1-like motif
MQYSSGTIGRVFALLFEHEDDVLAELKRLAEKEDISAGLCLFIGGMKKGRVVTGPKKPVIPPEPHSVAFKDGWDAIGCATLFRHEDGSAQVHVHSSLGKKGKALTGCLRGESQVFGMMEAVLFELRGIDARKAADPRTGLTVLRFKGAR